MSDFNLHGSRRLAAIAEMVGFFVKNDAVLRERREGDGNVLRERREGDGNVLRERREGDGNVLRERREGDGIVLRERREGDGIVLADVGTDHAYLPIALCERNVVSRAVAADVNAGPLERAALHIKDAGLSHRIETRLSDGLAEVRPGEADVITICGMGGELVLAILARGIAVARKARLVVLAPQSKLYEVRRGLREAGFSILKEDLVEEDGKFYPILAVAAKAEGRTTGDGEDGRLHRMALAAKDEGEAEGRTTGDLTELYDRYGYDLIENKNPILLSYLKQEEQRYLAIAKRVEGRRAEEVARQLWFCRWALRMMEE